MLDWHSVKFSKTGGQKNEKFNKKFYVCGYNYAYG